MGAKAQFGRNVDEVDAGVQMSARAHRLPSLPVNSMQRTSQIVGCCQNALSSSVEALSRRSWSLVAFCARGPHAGRQRGAS